MEQRPSFLWRMLRALWRGIDLSRRLVLNLIFFGCLLVLVAWWLLDDTPEAPEAAILVLDPRGELVEQKTGDPLELDRRNQPDIEAAVRQSIGYLGRRQEVGAEAPADVAAQKGPGQRPAVEVIDDADAQRRSLCVTSTSHSGSLYWSWSWRACPTTAPYSPPSTTD